MTVEREDILISRVVDREATLPDWCELDRLASRRVELWHELIHALRQDAAVRTALAPALETADRCMPAVAGAATKHRRRSLRTWSGWVAAALVMGLWIVSGSPRSPERTRAPDAGFETARIADGEPVPGAARTEVAAPGSTVLRELPRLVVKTRPTEDGRGLDVLYVRRVLERAVVNALYQIHQDEHGRPIPTPVNLALFEPPSTY